MIVADDKKAAGIQAAVTAPETTTKESESDETKEYSLCRSNDLHENEYITKQSSFLIKDF